MRIIHTADWHIGQLFYGYDRVAEHTVAFAALRDIVALKQPDVLLVSGDVFHNPQPSATAQAMLTRVITELRDAAPKMTIILTAGNHDSASRHEIFSDAWRRLGVYAIGSVADNDDDNFQKLIVEVPGGFVVSVPYVYGRSIDDGLVVRLLAEVEKRNTDGLPVVVMAHAMMAFAGIIPESDDKGADEPKSLELFGHGYDYLALGHVHHPSAMPGTRGAVRYSGSIIPLNFSENFRHSVVMADIDVYGAEPRIELLPMPDIMPVVSIPTSGFRPWSEALGELRNYRSEIPSYVRLCVSRDEAVPPDAAETAAKICEERGHRFCLVHYPPLDCSGHGGKDAGLSFDEFREMTPADVAKLYARDNGIAFSDAVWRLFAEVVDTVKSEEDEP